MTGVAPSRPNLVTLDEAAFAANLACVRSILPPETGIWQVCKGDGYGLGLLRAADLGYRAGLRNMCAGTPEEAVALRSAYPDVDILLFPSAQSSDLPELAALGITLTVHNRASLTAVLDHAPGARFWFKVDTGLARYGFGEADFPEALEQYRKAGHGGLRGVYTHLSQAQAPASATTPLIRYEQMLAIVRAKIDRPLLSMAAASPTLFSHPQLPYDCADPGRALYGMLPPPEAGGHHLRPVVKSVTSVLMDSRDLSQATASLGYGKDAVVTKVTRVGTMPMGHFDGLSATGELGTVLIRGKEVRVLSRTLLASIIDLSNVPEAVDGDVITLVGHSGSLERDLFGFAASMRTSATALHFTLIRNLPKANWL